MSEAIWLFSDVDLACRTGGRRQIHYARSRSCTRTRRHTTVGIGDIGVGAAIDRRGEIA